jgi:hypothetical protein
MRYRGKGNRTPLSFLSVSPPWVSGALGESISALSFSVLIEKGKQENLSPRDAEAQRAREGGGLAFILKTQQLGALPTTN